MEDIVSSVRSVLGMVYNFLDSFSNPNQLFVSIIGLIVAGIAINNGGLILAALGIVLLGSSAYSLLNAIDVVSGNFAMLIGILAVTVASFRLFKKTDSKLWMIVILIWVLLLIFGLLFAVVSFVPSVPMGEDANNFIESISTFWSNLFDSSQSGTEIVSSL